MCGRFLARQETSKDWAKGGWFIYADRNEICSFLNPSVACRANKWAVALLPERDEEILPGDHLRAHSALKMPNLRREEAS